MKLSSKAHYGLQACQILAGRYGDAVSATELEEKIGVSGKYLEKIMRILTQNSIVTARRGASGGYMLVRPPERTTVGEITRALEDDMRLVHCVSSVCDKCECKSGKVWRKLYAKMNEFLDSVTLRDMLEESF